VSIEHQLQLPPTLNENISRGVVGTLWTQSDWRCYANAQLVEKFLSEDAMTLNVFKGLKRAFTPDNTFSWHAETGTTHTGALYQNGAVYRQVNAAGRVVDFLLIDEETARLKGYPDDGWVLLKEWSKELKVDGEHSEGPAVSR
jgi:hypothetical protein